MLRRFPIALSEIGPEDELQKHDSPVVGKHFSNHAAVTQFYFNHEPEKGLCAPSPHSNHHSYLEGFSTDYIITQSVPTDSMLKAIEQDHASATNDLHRTLIPRSHYEILPMHPSTKVPLTDLNIPLDGSIISIGLINLLSTSRGTVTLASTGYIAGPARSIRTIALRRSPASFYEQRCYRMFFNTTVSCALFCDTNILRGLFLLPNELGMHYSTMCLLKSLARHFLCAEVSTRHSSLSMY